MPPAEPRRPVWRLPVGFLNQMGATRIEDVRGFERAMAILESRRLLRAWKE
jgi:hypothetical protein